VSLGRRSLLRSGLAAVAGLASGRAAPRRGPDDIAYVTDGGDDLTLLPSDADRTVPVEAGCWRLREPVAVTGEYRTESLSPDESVSRVVAVGHVGDPGSDVV